MLGRILGAVAVLGIVAESVTSVIDAIGTWHELYRADAAYWRDSAQTSQGMFSELMSAVSVANGDAEPEEDDDE